MPWKNPSSIQDRQPVAIFDVTDDPRIQYSEKDFNTQLEQAKSYLNTIAENFHKKDIGTQTVVANGPAVERIIQIAE